MQFCLSDYIFVCLFPFFDNYFAAMDSLSLGKGKPQKKVFFSGPATKRGEGGGVG